MAARKALLPRTARSGSRVRREPRCNSLSYNGFGIPGADVWLVVDGTDGRPAAPDFSVEALPVGWAGASAGRQRGEQGAGGVLAAADAIRDADPVVGVAGEVDAERRGAAADAGDAVDVADL